MRRRDLIVTRGFATGTVLVALLLMGGVRAQSLLDEKLNATEIGGIEPGAYDAGDDLHFTLDPYGDNYLFHRSDEPEVFVLHSDRASLGGKLLKYDSGATALQVSGWGALTLYTDAQPEGLPAVRDGDSTPPAPQPISLNDLQLAAQDEAAHLAYARKVNLTFSADWRALSADANARAVVFDAMQNVARGLERFAQRDDARSAVAQRISSVKLTVGKNDGVLLWGRTLVVGIDANKGYAGRASSRAVAQSLAKLLSVRQAAND